MLTFVGASHIGKIRKDNQDSFLTRSLSDEVGFAVVCDGMGGANGGSVASRMAAETIAEVLTREYNGETEEEAIYRLLTRACETANAEVYRRSQRESELDGMDTTAVIALVCGQKAHILHVGDSRAYLLADAFTQITNDHSMVQELVDSGEITAEAAKTHPQKNMITRAVGVEGFITCDCDTVPFEKGNILLLCTDGLTNMVSDEDIKNILTAKADPERLISAALTAGGRDNVTVVLVY